MWDLTDQKRATGETYRATRYAHLVRDVALAANSAITMREALQRSVDVICETMDFPVGHALLIDDDEPALAKSSHIVHVRDMERFRKLLEISNSMSWPSAKGTPEEVMRTGKPAIHDIWEDAKTPELYPRCEVSIEAGLRTGLLFPVVVDQNVEAILEFASEELLVSDEDLIGSLTAATERLSRFFERPRAQIKFLKQKEELQTVRESPVLDGRPPGGFAGRRTSKDSTGNPRRLYTVPCRSLDEDRATRRERSRTDTRRI